MIDRKKEKKERKKERHNHTNPIHLTPQVKTMLWAIITLCIGSPFIIFQSYVHILGKLLLTTYFWGFAYFLILHLTTAQLQENCNNFGTIAIIEGGQP